MLTHLGLTHDLVRTPVSLFQDRASEAGFDRTEPTLSLQGTPPARGSDPERAGSIPDRLPALAWRATTGRGRRAIP